MILHINMHSTPQTQTAQSKDLDILQRIIHYEEMELETYHNTTDRLTEMDPDTFLYPIINNCNYFTQEQYKSMVHSEGKLSIIHFNSRSMYRQFDSIKDYFQLFTHPFNVIAISETWFNLERGIHFSLEGSELLYKNRNNKTAGGVALYIHRSLKFNIVQDMTIAIDELMECIIIEIQMETKKNVSCIYRTPG